MGQPWDLGSTFLVLSGCSRAQGGNLEGCAIRFDVAWMLAAVVDVQFGAVPTAAV